MQYKPLVSQIANKRNASSGRGCRLRYDLLIADTQALSLSRNDGFEEVLTYRCAMHSISTSVFMGNSLTATQVRH